MAVTFTRSTTETDWRYGGENAKRRAVKKGTLVITTTAANPTASDFGLVSLLRASPVINNGTYSFLTDVASNTLYALDLTNAATNALVRTTVGVGSYTIEVEGDY